MELYKRQQFEFLLQTAVERLCERLEQRHRGCEGAMRVLKEANASSEVNDFVEAIFRDFLLDNMDGACFVLQAFPQKRLGQPHTMSAEQTLETVLVALAKQQFLRLLHAKTLELLEQHSGYQAVEVGAEPR